jgi:hypothetical protein
MDRDLGIDLETQLHLRASNPEHRDFQQAMETIGPADYHRFPVFP